MARKKETNANRFLKSYNAIDYSLRSQYDFKRSMAFTDVVRRAVLLNSVVRKYEDDLIDFSRLRNAIVHSGIEEIVIAEPHIEIVEKIEKIEKLITTPPIVYDTVCRKDVLVVDHNETIKTTIRKISESGYSNIPVYDGDEMIGIANGQKILDILGKAIIKGENIESFVENITIGEIIREYGFDNYYVIVPKSITLEEVLNLFHSNRKLLVILITDKGTNFEQPLGVVTVSDIIDINNILDSY